MPEDAAARAARENPVDDDPAGAVDQGDALPGRREGDNTEPRHAPLGAFSLPEPQKIQPEIVKPSKPLRRGRPADPSAPRHQDRAVRRSAIDFNSAAIRKYFCGPNVDLLGVIGGIIRGDAMLCQQSPKHRAIYLRPSLELRAKTAVDLLNKLMPQEMFAAIEQHVTTEDVAHSDPRHLSRAILAALGSAFTDVVEGSAIAPSAVLPHGEPVESHSPDSAGSHIAAHHDASLAPITVDPSDDLTAAGAGFIGRDASGMSWAIFDSQGRPFEGSIPSRAAAVARAEHLSKIRQLS